METTTTEQTARQAAHAAYMAALKTAELLRLEWIKTIEAEQEEAGK